MVLAQNADAGGRAMVARATSPAIDHAAMDAVPAGGAGGAPFAAIRAFLRQPAVQRMAPVAAMILAAGMAAAMWLALSAPTQRELVPGLNDADKAAVAAALDQAGIGYELAAATGALVVPDTDWPRARMALAAAGLPKAPPAGDGIMAAMPMGASRAVEGDRLRQAREMDLARTIEAIEAVGGARVHLAVEQPSAFVRDRPRAAASVMLTLVPGRVLSDAQVQAIVHLVASSVPGLEADGVSVVDQSGRLLSAPGMGITGGPADQQLRVQTAIEDRHRQALATLLTPLLGAGRFTAEVSAAVDFSERQATRETYPADGGRVRSERGRWSAEDAAGPAYGIPGALSNTPPPPTTLAPGIAPPAPPPGEAVIASDRRRGSEEFQRQFDLGREVAVTRDAVGTVRRLSVAVAIANPPGGKSRSAGEIAAIEALVKGAVGYDINRGDQVTVSARAFVDTPGAGDAPWHQQPWMEAAVRNGSALLVILVTLGIGALLWRRHRKAAAAATAEREARVAALIGALDAQGGPVAGSNGVAARDSGPVPSLDALADEPSYAERAVMLRRFVADDPDRAAVLVRDLLARGEAARTGKPS